MPAAARTSRTEIIGAARHILDESGVEAVTMSAVAAAVGVRGPSLYKHVDDRAELIRFVAEGAVDEIGQEMARAVRATDDPVGALIAAGHAFRAYAHAFPHACALVFGPLPEDQRASAPLNRQAANPLFDVVSALLPADQVLPATRTLTAWANGFVAMELNGAFRAGGDVDTAFVWGLHAIVGAIAEAGRQPLPEAAVSEPAGIIEG